MTDDDLATVASTTGSRIVICVVGFTAVTAISDSLAGFVADVDLFCYLFIIHSIAVAQPICFAEVA